MQPARWTSFVAALLLSIGGQTGGAKADEAEQAPAAASPAPAWNAKFDGDRGWVGGDVAYAAVVSPQRVVWLFGDTLWGEVRDDGRPGAAMVSNSVGVQRGISADDAIQFYGGPRRADGPPGPVFVPDDGRGWFWPQAPLVVGERLLVFLAQIEKTPQDDVLAGFRHVGQTLATIDNPADDPAQWKIRQQRLACSTFGADGDRSFGSAVLVDKLDALIYGYLERVRGPGKKQLIVARAPLDKLTDLSAWQYRSQDGWSDSAADVAPLAGGLASEFSVSRMRDGRVLLVYTADGLSDRILGRLASDPAGPWSEPQLLCTVPEMSRDKGLFCYAAKAQPWAQAAPGQLLVSYCSNSWDFGRLFQDQAVYRPRFVSVKLPGPPQVK